MSGATIEERFPDSATFGNRLVVEDLESEAVQLHLDHLSLVPSRLHRELVAKGLECVLIGDKTVPEFPGMEIWRDQPPRGWPDGMRWNDVPGCYDVAGRRLILGGGGASQGSESLALHEYGHAVDHLFGSLSGSQRFRGFHEAFIDILPDYLVQDGPGDVAACQELFAESFALAVLEGPGYLADLYHPDYATFFEELLS